MQGQLTFHNALGSLLTKNTQEWSSPGSHEGSETEVNPTSLFYTHFVDVMNTLNRLYKLTVKVNLNGVLGREGNLEQSLPSKCCWGKEEKGTLLHAGFRSSAENRLQENHRKGMILWIFVTNRNHKIFKMYILKDCWGEKVLKHGLRAHGFYF